MDKYELTIKIEQLNKLVKGRDFVSAAKVAEQIDWKKMKQWSVMSNAIDAFVATEKYDKARNVCIYAYNRKLGGRRLLATLMEMYVHLGEYEDAEEIYQEYVELAPRDVTGYILLYKLKRAQGAPATELIDILQEYKEKELDEEYEYELAMLYSEAGMTDKCVRECDELVLWFADGVYVEKALRLKQMYVPLTKKQSEKLARLERMSAMGINSSEAVPAHEPDSAVYEAAAAGEEYVPEYGEPEAEYAPKQSAREPEAEYAPKQSARKSEAEYAAWQPGKESAASLEVEPEAGYTLSAAEEKYAEEGIHGTKVSADEIQSMQAADAAQSMKTAMEEMQSPQTAEKSRYIDDIENTTEWSPIEINKAVESAGTSKVKAEGTPKAVSGPSGESASAGRISTQDMASVKADVQQNDGDMDINIKVPDYSVYDTRNVQQELKANVKEIMEAYNNRERTEALREAAELADMAGDSDPTKEIIINKHQWRKASRNIAQGKDRSRQGKSENKAEGMGGAAAFKISPDATIREAAQQMTLEQMAELVAQLQAEQERRRREAAKKDAQAAGQMDISQWLSDLDEDGSGEETTVKVEVQTEASKQQPDMQLQKESPKQQPDMQLQKESPKQQPDMQLQKESPKQQPDMQLQKEPPKQQPDVQAQEPEEEAEKESGTDAYNPAERAAIEQTVREIAASVEKSKRNTAPEPDSTADQSTEEEFEEIPDVEEDNSEAEGDGYSDAFASRSTEEQPDLEKAINVGIEKIIDDAIKDTMGDHALGRYVLKDEEKRFLDKYLYMAGMERRLCRYIGAKRAEAAGSDEKAGNIAVMGSRSTDKTAFAVNLFKAIHVFDEKREQKLARISADKLNEKGFEFYADRLVGQTLVIENAGRLRHEQTTAMMNSGEQDTTLIIVDEEFEINKLFAENPDFAELFTGRFLLKQYTVNELVDIAKDYAEENGWRVEDKALLKLYLILSQISGDEQGNAVEIVKEIMEHAANHAKRSIGNRLFGRFRSVVVIKETDFRPIEDDDEEYDDEEYDDEEYDDEEYDDEEYDEEYDDAADNTDDGLGAAGRRAEKRGSGHGDYGRDTYAGDDEEDE